MEWYVSYIDYYLWITLNLETGWYIYSFHKYES